MGRASGSLATLVLAALTLTGCSAAPPATPNPAPGDDPAPAHAVLRRPTQGTAVLDKEAGPGLAVATSAVLFQSSPVVVLAPAGDKPGMRDAEAIAAELGVPVLPASGGSGGPVADELARLSPRVVLSVGAHSNQKAEKLAGQLPVVTTTSVATGKLPDTLPNTEPPPPADVTALVVDAHSHGAAAATARAAGARVLALAGTDPRADTESIETLHEQPAGAVLALGAGFAPAKRLRKRLRVAGSGDQLPGGGQVMFPGRRLVGLYGHPGTPALGALGEQGIQGGIDRAKQLAAHYDELSDAPVVPTFEILATVATETAGADGDYSAESTVEELRPWVKQAGQAGLYVVLDLQPGRADLLQQAKRYRQLLKLPYVGIALDPEWKLGPHQLPLQQIGSIDAAAVNRVSAWLAEVTAEHHLPQKLLVLHQFTTSMVRHEPAIDTGHDEISLLVHMDGQGSPTVKNSSWQTVLGAWPDSLPFGWKNFYDEDHPLLSPAQTMSHNPTPAMISYQ